jgi:hypothetical protein
MSWGILRATSRELVRNLVHDMMHEAEGGERAQWQKAGYSSSGGGQHVLSLK